jgi:hypothetical protein
MEEVKEPQMGLSFEQVWAMFQETDKKFAETRKLIEENAKKSEETRKELAEHSKETDRKFDRAEKLIEENAKAFAETRKELRKELADVGKYIKRVGKHIGEVDTRLGDIVEHIMSPGAKTAFEGLGYRFPKATPNVPIYGIVDGKKKKLAEVDLFLESDARALAIEIKVKAAAGDVNRHLRRMEILRQDADKRGDTRPLLGGIAGTMVSETVRDYALENGLFAIEQSGIDLNIVPPQGQPKEW